MDPVAKKVFISYAHEDRAWVEELAKGLNAKGVPLFYDKWDIKPGDSIVQRIFEEGLAQCGLFAVVLSRASAASKWVRDELDAATVQRIEGVTRVVPLLKEDCEIPVSLRARLWLDMRAGMEEGVDRLTKLAYGVDDRPAPGPAPVYVQALAESVGGLSRRRVDCRNLPGAGAGADDPFQPQFAGRDIAAATHLASEMVNDAIDELETAGMVQTVKFFGTAPYDFGTATPTYALFLHFKHCLSYDPLQDLRVVASAAVALNRATANELAEKTGLSAGRLNRAVNCLGDQGRLEVLKYFGTTPYSFGQVQATRHTRDLVG